MVKDPDPTIPLYGEPDKDRLGKSCPRCLHVSYGQDYCVNCAEWELLREYVEAGLLGDPFLCRCEVRPRHRTNNHHRIVNEITEREAQEKPGGWQTAPPKKKK